MKNLEIQHTQNLLENITGRVAVLQDIFYPRIDALTEELQHGIETILDDIRGNIHDIQTFLESHKQPENIQDFPTLHQRIAPDNGMNTERILKNTSANRPENSNLA